MSFARFHAFPKAAAAVLLAAALVYGQTTYSSIVGNLVDPSGAPAPGVAITVTNDGTGVRSTAKTDENGNYLVDKLIAGQYTVSAEKAGFNTFVNRGLTLQSQQTLRVNINLVLGSTNTSLMVTAEAPVLETESGEVGFTQTSHELDTLPVITSNQGLGASTFPTRDPMNYVFTLPGSGTARGTSAGKISVNGAVEGSTIIRVDGNNVRDNSNGIGYAGRPMLEATGEVKVIGVNAPAEFDGQATVLIASKSGGNDIHGGTFYEGQQRSLNAADFFLTSQRKPFTRRNDGGAYLGGPIKRNKAFYFGSWEAERTQNGTTLVRNLPLPAFKNGDFSALADPTFAKNYLGGARIMIRDPLNSGAPFPGNIIPTERINGVSKQIEDMFYKITPSQPGLAGNDNQGVTIPRDADKFDIRVDYNISDAHRLFSHFNYGHYQEQNYSEGPLPEDIRTSAYPSRQFSVSDTYSFSPSVVNEFKGGYFRYQYLLEGELSKQNKDFQHAWGIQGVGLNPGLPSISIDGFSRIASLRPIAFKSQSWELLDNLTVIKGRHSFKAGYSLNRPGFAFVYDLGDTGSWSITNRFTGYSYSDFLLGYPSSASLDFPSPEVDTRAFEHSAFVQDTFQATRNLTLNYGLRWQDHLRATAKNDLISNFDPVSKSVVIPSDAPRKYINPQFPTNVPVSLADKVGYPHSLWNTNPWDFAPRISFAYRLGRTTDTVIRGGYGLYFATYDLDLSNSMGSFGIFRASQASPNFVMPGTTVPQRQFPSPYRSDFAAGQGRVGYFAVAKDLPNAHYQQVNVTLERAFGSNRLALSYIGNFGAQDIVRDLNQAPPSMLVYSQDRRPIDNFDAISYWDVGNHYNYNTLQFVAERRFKGGLFFRGSYNWTKALTRSDNDNGDTGGGPENARNLSAEYGNVAWTPRHSATITYVYELPFGHGKPLLRGAQGILEHTIGGWQLNGIMQFRTGLWFTPAFSGYDPSGTGSFGGRPDRIANGNLPSGQRTIDAWFDPRAFVCPGQSGQLCNPAITTPMARFGTSGRNILDGPGIRRWDFSIFKNFPIPARESMNLQLRMEFINFTNTPEFGLPSSNISDPANVGHIRSTLAGTARQSQFGARFQF